MGDTVVVSCEHDAVTFDLLVNQWGYVGIRDDSDPSNGGMFYADSAATVYHGTIADSGYRHLRLEERPRHFGEDELVTTSHIFFAKDMSLVGGRGEVVSGYVIRKSYSAGSEDIEEVCESVGGGQDIIEAYDHVRQQYDMTPSIPENANSMFDRDFSLATDADPRP